jgi:hypothetical protein
MGMRQVLVVGVVVVGVCATTATSSVDDAAGFPLRSPQKTLDLSLSAAAPEVRFVVTATSRAPDAPLSLRAETNIDDDDPDNVDDTDGAFVVDVGVVAPGAALADPIDGDDGAGVDGAAAVREGAFAVEDAMVDGAAAVALRLRPGVASARVRLILTASAVLAEPAAGARLELEVDPEAPVR